MQYPGLIPQEGATLLATALATAILPPPTADHILLESGDDILLESGDLILLE
jgi:hypothetical protein